MRLTTCLTTYKNSIKKPYRGVAQLVAREVWDFDAAGSSPVTPTNSGIHKVLEYQKNRGFGRS